MTMPLYFLINDRIIILVFKINVNQKPLQKQAGKKYILRKSSLLKNGFKFPVHQIKSSWQMKASFPFPAFKGQKHFAPAV